MGCLSDNVHHKFITNNYRKSGDYLLWMSKPIECTVDDLSEIMNIGDASKEHHNDNYSTVYEGLTVKHSICSFGQRCLWDSQSTHLNQILPSI